MLQARLSLSDVRGLNLLSFSIKFKLPELVPLDSSILSSLDSRFICRLLSYSLFFITNSDLAFALIKSLPSWSLIFWLSFLSCRSLTGGLKADVCLLAVIIFLLSWVLNTFMRNPGVCITIFSCYLDEQLELLKLFCLISTHFWNMSSGCKKVFSIPPRLILIYVSLLKSSIFLFYGVAAFSPFFYFTSSLS